MTGRVDYKMKHIRLQNRHLKLRPPTKRSKHTHFDDDGNEIEILDDVVIIYYIYYFICFKASFAEFSRFVVR